MMRNSLTTLAGWRTDLERLQSSYRRLAASKLPVNLYSAHAPVQRRAATLLHGLDETSCLWEELDGRLLADDKRGDRTSLHLGGATGGVALSPQDGKGLLSAAGAGTLFLEHIEKLSPAAQHILCRIIESGRYTPVGDPYPRPVRCRLIVATVKPLMTLAREFKIDWHLAEALGHVSLSADEVLSALEREELLQYHPSSLAAAS